MCGILLGKTMGRGDELADRFERESERLADLEVRSRMAGRWMMASIQTSFAVMPALVYLFAGLDAGRGDDRHPGRVHDAADAAVLADPVAAQRRRRHPDLDGAVRARVRVPRPRGRPARRARRARPRARRRALRRRLVQVRRGVDAARRRPRGAGRARKLALVGETGSGKTTVGYLAARLYDPEQRQRAARRDRPARAALRLARRRRRRRLAGDLPLPRQRAREPALRAVGGDRRGDRGGGPRRPDPRHDRRAARRLRHGGRRARLPLLRRRAPADRDRPHDPAQPAGARARRGHERARRADRARGRRRARAARRGAHDDRHRPPAVDGPRRRPDRRARRRRRWSSAARTRSCWPPAAATPSWWRGTRARTSRTSVECGFCQAPDFLRWACEASSVRRTRRRAARALRRPRRSRRGAEAAGQGRREQPRGQGPLAQDARPQPLDGARPAVDAERLDHRGQDRQRRGHAGQARGRRRRDGRDRRRRGRRRRRSPTARSAPRTSVASGAASARRSAPIPVGKCWSGEPTGLPPDLANVDISNDLVLVQPDDHWLERRLTFSVRPSSIPSRFVLSACNVGAPIGGILESTSTRDEVSFRYLVIDLP